MHVQKYLRRFSANEGTARHEADQSPRGWRPQVERDELSLFNVATQGIMDAWNLLKNLILITIEYLGLR